MSPDEETIRRYWDEIWSEGRFDLAGEVYAPRYRENLHDRTPEEFAAGAARWRAHFSGFRIDVEELFSVEHRVITRVTYRGTHTGDFTWLPAQGGEYALSGIDIFEFENGRVVQHWHETDHLDLFEQLGAELRANDPPR